MECISALHHNKCKTNYHIHLIFSERELLDKPLEKVATRNMFYNEKGKHCRTKTEILDDNGNLRKGCKILKKGELDRKIALKDEEAEVLKKGLSGIVRQYGFANVQEFYNTFRTSEDAYRRYQKELSKWEDTYGENAKPKEESFSEKLQRYQKQVLEQNWSYTSSHRDRGAR